MKKTFIAIIAFLAMSASAFAGQQSDTTRYLATKAWKNWFISADGNIDSWKGSDKKKFHVRPKAQLATDLAPTPNGGKAKKYCYWFNNDYVREIIDKRNIERNNG